MKKNNFICLILLATILQTGCATVKKDITANIISVNKKEITLDKGARDGIEKRQIYEIYDKVDKDIRVAKIVISDVEQDKSTGKIIRNLIG